MAKSTFDKLKEKAKKLGIAYAEDVKESDLEKLVEEKTEVERKEKEMKDEAERKAAEEAKKNKIILKNVLGEDVKEDDYFYKKKDANGNILGGVPAYFNKICGLPVEREDLLEVFNRIFNPKHGFLFYKSRDTEVYIIIVPIKHADSVGAFNDSMPGDFQKHAISFINEGSVNLESLRMKLERVSKTIRIKE